MDPLSNNQEEKIYAKKSLGQNFLNSEKALFQIVEAGDIKAEDTILEIGPGKGALTKKIIEKEPQLLIMVEKDDRLIPVLENEFKDFIKSKKMQCIHGDILELLNEPGLKTLTKNGLKAPYKVIANIPYYITGQVIRNLLELKNKPEKVVLLLQKEVVERIIAQDKKESLLSLSVKLYGTPKKIAVVPRGAFFPAPNVDSAILLIDVFDQSIPQKQVDEFFEVIKGAFAHKRKRLVKNLEGVLGKTSVQWENELVLLGLDKNARAEDLSVDTYKKIAGIL